MHEQQSARAFNSHAAWVHNLRRSYEERRNSALSVEESSRDEDMAFEDSLSRARNLAAILEGAATEMTYTTYNVDNAAARVNVTSPPRKM